MAYSGGKEMFLSFKVLIVLTVVLQDLAFGVRYPVILVPGDGGSQFLAKLDKNETVHYVCDKKTDDYFDLWLNLELLAPIVIDCFVDNMRLRYDNITHKTHNQPGVDIVIPNFGNTSSVEFLDDSRISVSSYYSEVVKNLVSWGYVRGHSVRGAPYDFRKAPNEFGEFYKNMTWLIEDTFAQNNGTPVVLVAHSMGNPTMLYYLNHQSQAWKDKYIRRWVTLSGVWGGAVKPLRLFASGDSLNVPLVKPINVRVEQRSMPSTAFLMPSDDFWTADEVLVSQPKRNYTVKDYKAFFMDLGLPNAYLMRQDTEKLVHDLNPPGVEVHCLHGINMKTPAQFNYLAGMWPDTQPYVVYGQGDGTVNIHSLHGCLRWKGKQKQAVYHKEFNNTEHTDILSSDLTMQYLKKVVFS